MLKIKINIEDINLVEKIIFTIKSETNKLQKTYPTDIGYIDGEFYISLTQEETLKLRGDFEIESQINYINKSVAKSNTYIGHFDDTLATELVNGNVPQEENQSIDLLISPITIVFDNDYDILINKPSIDGVELIGDFDLISRLLAILGEAKEYTDEEVGKIDLSSYKTKDVEVNGNSIVENGVADIPIANTNDMYGLMKGNASFGISVTSNGSLAVSKADTQSINTRASSYRPIVPNNLDYAVKSAITDGRGVNWTEIEKSNARNRMGVPSVNELNTALAEAKLYTDNELATFDFIKVVDSLPIEGLSNKIYFVPKQNPNTNDLFDEYVWINGKWEFITTKQIEIDLTEYAKNSDLAETLKEAKDYTDDQVEHLPFYNEGNDGNVLTVVKDDDSQHLEWKDLSDYVKKDDVATTSTDGLMSAGDKNKLNAIDLYIASIDDEVNTKLVYRGDFASMTKNTLTDTSIKWTATEQQKARQKLGIEPVEGALF